MGALFALACASTRSTPAKAVAESPDPFVRMADVEQKRQAILDEIKRLGPDHPWAGVYSADMGVPYSLVIAPEAGCVSTIFGCFGLRDSHWSPADVSLTPPRSETSSTAVRGHVNAFGETFVLLRDGPNPMLKDESGRAYWRQRAESVPFEKMR